MQDVAPPATFDLVVQEPHRIAAHPALFASLDDNALLSIGVPADWMADVRAATGDGFFVLAPHLPAEASEALLACAATGRLHPGTRALAANGCHTAIGVSRGFRGIVAFAMSVKKRPIVARSTSSSGRGQRRLSGRRIYLRSLCRYVDQSRSRYGRADAFHCNRQSSGLDTLCHVEAMRFRKRHRNPNRGAAHPIIAVGYPPNAIWNPTATTMDADLGGWQKARTPIGRAP